MTEVACRIDRVGWRLRLAALSRHSVANRLLAAAAAAALGIDAYVHASDAYFYESNGGGIITQVNIFYAETAVASLVAVLLLLRPRLTSWLLALTIAATALGAVVLYRYVDVGAIGPIPDLYEPTWQVPGKIFSAYAEGSAVLLSIAGLVLNSAVLRPRRQGM